ncbi:hypothetical protein HDU99_000070 [Rhizoclosmatium hyalinum]|nr:hypothetical protein HDU99_000070 [Rhizoclosmatium hyalinum]
MKNKKKSTPYSASSASSASASTSNIEPFLSSVKKTKPAKETSVLQSLLSISAVPTKGATFRVDAKNDLLSKVASFLPQLKQANESLQQTIEAGQSVDIEHVDESEQHIEMDLGLGVFDYAPEDIHKIPKKDVILLKKDDDDSESDKEELVTLKLKPDSDDTIDILHPKKDKKKRPKIEVLK